MSIYGVLWGKSCLSARKSHTCHSARGVGRLETHFREELGAGR